MNISLIHPSLDSGDNFIAHSYLDLRVGLANPLNERACNICGIPVLWPNGCSLDLLNSVKCKNGHPIIKIIKYNCTRIKEE